MPHDDHNSGELVEALIDVYTTGQIGRILSTVKWGSDVQSDKIQRQIQNAAWLYEPYRRLLLEEGRPSDRERRLQPVLKKLRAASAAVQGLSSADLDHLNSAGQDLGKTEGRLPDVEPERVTLPPPPGQTEPDCMNIWDGARQIDAGLERLNWLVRCVERAIERVGREKLPHGGAVADDPLHAVIRKLNKTYLEYAADPRTPGTNIGDGSRESRTWRQSELLDFLEAALCSLGIQKSREAIYGDWRRATAEDDDLGSGRKN